MTMIISAHLGDCILIAADKRAMVCDLESGALRHHTDQEQKIRRWCRGAIAGSGETVFVNRVMDYFVQLDESEKEIKQINIIFQELIKRISEGVPIASLQNNIITYSMFDGYKTHLYWISMEPFLELLTKFFSTYYKNDIFDIKNLPQLEAYEITAWLVDVSCFNLPPDISSLQKFQRQLKPLSDFETEQKFIEYYSTHLKEVFSLHAQIDPSITTSFDLYLQSCATGGSVAKHVFNTLPPSKIPSNMNYWEKHRELLGKNLNRQI